MDCNVGVPLKSQALFAPDSVVAAVAADIVEHAVFEQATALNRWRRPSRAFAVAGRAWLGIRLRKGGCKVADLVLDPFAVRLTREESALRLALEATHLRVRWDFIAVRVPSAGSDAAAAGRSQDAYEADTPNW